MKKKIILFLIPMVLFCLSADASKFRKINLCDEDLETCLELDTDADGKTYLPTHDADFHKTMITRNLVEFTGTTDTTNHLITSGNTTVTVSTPGTFSAGDWLSITSGTSFEPNFSVVIDDTNDPQLILDRPFDTDYPLGAAVESVDQDLGTAVGSLSSPIIYKVCPPSDETWHMTRILLASQDDNIQNISTFSGIAAITNGIVFRYDKDGVKRTLTNWKKNADMMEDVYDVDFDLKAPASVYGMRARWTFKRSDAIVNLIGANGECLEVLVQDDLSAITDLQIKSQGHKEDE